MKPSTCPTDELLWLSVTDASLLASSDREHIEACETCRNRSGTIKQEFESVSSCLSELPTAELHPQPLPDRYRFLARLGRGGFGEVWLAHDLKLDRNVAIKTLSPGQFRPSALNALRDEAKYLAKLGANRQARQHIVQIFDWEEAGGQFFLIMEYVEGGALAGRVRRFGPLNWRKAACYIADIGEALVEVHRVGLIHRDIKPDNILWDSQNDEALLADFGIAARANDLGLGGTIGYLAPELGQSPSTPASDVFSLAASFYQLLTGNTPFVGSDVHESLRLAAAGIPSPDPTLTRLPPAIEAALRSALHPNPSRRLDLASFTESLRGAAALEVVSSLAPRRVSESGLDLAVEPSQSDPNGGPPTPLAIRAPVTRVDSPATPPRVRMATGQRVRLEYRSRSGGYLTLLNVGSSGKVSIIFPNQKAPINYLPAGGRKAIVVMTKPPAGTELAIGILTREPESLLPSEWRDRVATGQPAIEAYGAYRDLEFVEESISVAPPDDWATASLMIEHG